MRSTTYKVKDGDTFDLISRNVYGVESKDGVIKAANPSVLVLKKGIILTIPKQRIDFI